MNAETEIRPVLTLLRGGRVEGELPVVTIGPIDHLAEEDLKTIEHAVFEHELGHEDRAKAMIAELEQKLGITPADKAAAFGPQEPWEGDLLEALGLQPTDDGPAPLPHDPRRFNDVEMSQIERHDTARRIAKVRGNRKTVTQAEGKLADIARGRDRRVDLQERREGIRETIDLARAKGEAVDQGAGRIEISSRDGLRSMRKAGHITDAQYAVGLLYRAGYEARSGDLKAQEIGETSPGGHDNDRYVAARLKRAKLLDFVARVDRAVALGCITNPMSLRLLRSVAGEGTAITVWGHGRALSRNRDGLVQALDIALTLAKQASQERSGRSVDTENPGETSMKT